MHFMDIMSTLSYNFYLYHNHKGVTCAMTRVYFDKVLNQLILVNNYHVVINVFFQEEDGYFYLMKY